MFYIFPTFFKNCTSELFNRVVWLRINSWIAVEKDAPISFPKIYASEKSCVAEGWIIQLELFVLIFPDNRM